jgi:integrase
MARKVTGQVIEREGKRGTAYALRFTAYGKRRHETVGNSADGYTREQADEELGFVMGQVRRGVWRPPEPLSVPEEPEDEPTFHEFASEWFERHRGEWRPRTVEDYECALSHHLLPFFAKHRLAEITPAEVDRYKSAKVREREDGLVDRPLSNGTINKTLIRLTQILEEAVEYGHLNRNAAAGRRRRLPTSKPRRASLDERQLRAVFKAAGGNRALLTTAVMAGGLRVSELTGLRWRDVRLATGRLQVGESKTDAGVREVDLAPELRDELASIKAARKPQPGEFVFPGKGGRRRDRRAVARLLRRVIGRANARLEQEGYEPISEAVSFHSLRRTYASLLVAAGADPAYVMAQIGHRKAAFTLDVYTDVGNRRHAANARLGALLRSDEKAHNGTNADQRSDNATDPGEARARETAN